MRKNSLVVLGLKIGLAVAFVCVLNILQVVPIQVQTVWANPVHRTKPVRTSVSSGALLHQIPLARLGYASGIQLSGDSASDTLFIPVDENTSPKQFIVHLKPSPGMPKANIWATVNGNVIASETIPSDSSDWTIPLSSNMVQNGQLSLDFHTAIANPNACLGSIMDWVEIGPESTIQLAVQHPSSAPVMSDIFPSYLQQVNLYMTSPLTPAKAQAALDVTSYLTRHYKNLAPKVVVSMAKGSWSTPAPFTRDVLVGADKTEITTLHTPSGSSFYALALNDKNLSAAANTLFLTNPGIQSVPVQGLTNLSTVTNPDQLSGQRMTLASLGYTSQEVQGSGNVSINYAFSQADLGGPINHLDVRLGGVHSPLVSGATGYMNLTVNGTVFFSEPLSGTKIDLYVPVPTSLLQRDNTLSVQFYYTPPGGGCSVGSLPLTATIYNASYLQFTKGQTLSPGFDRFPQVYAGGFQVAFSNLDIVKLNEAVQLISSLQNTTRTTLKPEVTTTPAPKSPLLYIGKSAMPNSPLQLKPFELMNASGKPVMKYSPDSAFSAFEAYNTTLVLAGPDNLSQQLVSNIVEGQGWYALNGDAALLGTSGRVTHLSLQGSGLQARPLPPTTHSFWVHYRKWIYLGFFALLIAFLVWIYPKTVRKNKYLSMNKRVDNKLNPPANREALSESQAGDAESDHESETSAQPSETNPVSLEEDSSLGMNPVMGRRPSRRERHRHRKGRK